MVGTRASIRAHVPEGKDMAWLKHEMKANGYHNLEVDTVYNIVEPGSNEVKQMHQKQKDAYDREGLPYTVLGTEDTLLVLETERMIK